MRVETRQTLLEAPDVPQLLDALSQVLGAEIELLRLERKIDEEVRGSLFQNQREFYLQEQLKAIHRELGQDETDDVGELERQIEARKLPDAVRARALREAAQAAPHVAAVARVDGRAQLRRLDSRAAVDGAHRRRARRRRTRAACSTRTTTASRK